MILGSADILLTELLALLTPRQAAVLAQVAVCRAPMTLDDLAFTLSPGPGPAERASRRGNPAVLADLRADTARLADLTLLEPGEDIAMHPWTAELATRHTAGDPAVWHERALAHAVAPVRAAARQLRRPARHSPPPGRPAPLRRYRRHRRAGRADAAGHAGHRRVPGRGPPAHSASRTGLDPRRRPGGSGPAQRRGPAGRHPAAGGDPPAGPDPGRRRPRQHRMAARPVRQPQQARGRGGRGRGPGRRPRPPTRPPWTSGSAGRRRPRQHRLAARPVRQPQQARGRGGRGRGPGRRPRPPTRPPWTSGSGWPPPTPPTPGGSATCPSATTSSATWRSRPGTWPPPATAYQAALDIAARLAAADPANTEWQRDLSVSHDKLGDVAIAAGDLAAARDRLPGRPRHRGPAGRRRPRQHRMAARPVRQPQQARGRGGRGRGPGRRPRPPTRPPWTSGSGWPPPTPPTPNGSATCPSATTSSGTWRSRPGTWPPPATAYQAALDIRVRLAAADPANTEWQRDLSISHNKLGDVAAAAGDLAAARDRLPGRPRHPGPAGRRRPRQHRMAARPVRQPRTSSATWRSRPGTWPPPATAYQAALDIAGRLAAADPANTGWQRDLSISHNKLGDVAVAAGDLAAARDRYQAALDIRVKLAAADPANTGWQRDLSISHEQARRRRGRGRGPGRRPRPLPGRPRHRGPAGRRRPRPTPNGSATCHSYAKESPILEAALPKPEGQTQGSPP